MPPQDSNEGIKQTDACPNANVDINYRGFNGGKMIHIFELDKDTGLYQEKITSAEAETALREGTAFYKIDGSNGMILRGDDGEPRAFQRLDTRGRAPPEGCIRLPKGPNVDIFKDHSYWYQPITTCVQGKKAKQRNQSMLDVVEKHKDSLLAYGKYVSVEWVGTKFNKTPGVPNDVAIAIHVEQRCEKNFDRSYQGVKDLLLEADPPIEGLIFELDSVFWKVRADCFDKKCSFKTNGSSVRPPTFLA